MESEAIWNVCQSMRSFSIPQPHKVLSIIHDKMDHGKFTYHCFASQNTNTDMFTNLSLSAMRMIARDHGDQHYARYSLGLYQGDLNHIICKTPPQFESFIGLFNSGVV